MSRISLTFDMNHLPGMIHITCPALFGFSKHGQNCKRFVCFKYYVTFYGMNFIFVKVNVTLAINHKLRGYLYSKGGILPGIVS